MGARPALISMAVLPSVLLACVLVLSTTLAAATPLTGKSQGKPTAATSQQACDAQACADSLFKEMLGQRLAQPTPAARVLPLRDYQSKEHQHYAGQRNHHYFLWGGEGRPRHMYDRGADDPPYGARLAAHHGYGYPPSQDAPWIQSNHKYNQRQQEQEEAYYQPRPGGGPWRADGYRGHEPSSDYPPGHQPPSRGVFNVTRSFLQVGVLYNGSADATGALDASKTGAYLLTSLYAASSAEAFETPPVEIPDGPFGVWRVDPLGMSIYIVPGGHEDEPFVTIEGPASRPTSVTVCGMLTNKYLGTGLFPENSLLTPTKLLFQIGDVPDAFTGMDFSLLPWTLVFLRPGIGGVLYAVEEVEPLPPANLNVLLGNDWLPRPVKLRATLLE